MAKAKRQLQGLNPNRRRYTKQQIQQRRIGVWEMLCCGQTITQIAQHYGVTERTIERDQKWWEDRLGYKTSELKDPKNAAIDVGMTAAKLQKLAEDAYVEYVSATNPAVKARMLECSGKMLGLRHKILSDAGFLPKIGHEQEEGVTTKITFEARFGKNAPQAVFDDHRSRRRVLEAVAGYMKLGVSEDGLPVPETNDGIVVEDDDE